MNEKPVEEPGTKCVVLIGNLTQEGVTTKLRSLGYYYHNKRLGSTSTANWQSVVDLLASRRKDQTLVGVFVDMTASVFHLCRNEDYKTVLTDLIEELKQTKTTIYVYEKSLEGDFEGAGWSHDKDLVEAHVSTIKRFQEAGFVLMPFQRHHEVTASIVQILDDLDGGVLLRLYVPDKRYQSDQFNSFLRLFENYLKTVEKISFTIDQRKTDHGLVYIFSSKKDITSSDLLDAAMARFHEFMELCEHDTAKAKEMLVASSVSPVEAESVLARYSRDYRRLKLDTKHEYEQKLLVLRQKLEGEVLDAGIVTSVKNALSNPMPLSIVNNTGPISITVNNAIGQIFNGDITFTEEDNRILSLIDQHSEGLDAASLKSALSELKDPSAPTDEKKAAGQKIKGFLYKAASTVGEAVVKGLASYVEKKITGAL